MQKWACLLLIAASVICPAAPLHALDVSPVGTMEVEFQPMQSGGIKEGCTLVYRVVGQDWAYRRGSLISLAGNIAYHTNKTGDSLGLSLKISMKDSLDPDARMEQPFFAYLETPHGTTARSKFVKADGEPGFRLFTFQFDDEITKVLQDILSGAPVTIGFNRSKGGLDVLVPLDLARRRRSNEMLGLFAKCTLELTELVQKQLKK